MEVGEPGTDVDRLDFLWRGCESLRLKEAIEVVKRLAELLKGGW